MLVKFLRDSWLGEYLAKKNEVLELATARANMLINFGIVVEYKEEPIVIPVREPSIKTEEEQVEEKVEQKKTRRNNKK